MSELKVNTISEVTGANGVVIDSTKLKDGGVIIADAGNIGSASDTDALSISSGGVVTFTQKPVINSGVAIDNITIDGTEIDLSSGDLTVDVAGDIILDADGADVKISDGGTHIGTLSNSSSDFVVTSAVQDKDIIFKGDDNGSAITALTLDMSAAGAATFNNAITSGAVITSGAGLVIADAGNIGSASDTDAIAIASDGDVTFSQKIGVVTAHDLGTGIHVRTADSSGGVSADADELVLENSGHAGVTIASGNSSNGNIYFSDSGNSAIGYIQYGHDNNDLTIVTNDTGGTLIDSSGKIATGGETAPDVDGGGICIDHNASDAVALSFKNSDIAHGMTAQAETDTYAVFQKESAASGGLFIQGMSEASSSAAVRINGLAAGVNNGQTTGATGLVDLKGSKKDNNDIQNLGSGDNLVTFTSGSDGVQFIVKGDGEIYSNQTGTVSTYDSYEDAQMVRAFDLSHGKGVIKSKFDEFVKYNHEKLADLNLVGREDDGTPNHFVSVTGMQRLHNGAIWQQYTRHNQLLEAVYELAKESIGEEKANLILEKHEIKRLN